jgi:hypothetical protein
VASEDELEAVREMFEGTELTDLPEIAEAGWYAYFDPDQARAVASGRS